MKKTILLVEDEILIGTNEKLKLEKKGYNVILDTSGEKAISTVQKNNNIDIILMDINLGNGLNGFETSIKILEIKDLPIIFLSSYNDTASLKESEKISSYGYITKSSNITVIDTAIKMAIKLFNTKLRIDTYKNIENKYKKIFNYMSDAVFIADAETGMLMDANKSAQVLSGYSISEIRKMHQSELHPPEIKKDTIKNFQKHLKDGTEKSEHTLYTKNGDKIPVLISASGFFIQENRKYQIGIFYDLRDKIKTEKKLKESYEFLKTIFKAIITPLAVINVNNYTIEISNEAFGGKGYIGQKCHKVSHNSDEPCSGNEHTCPIKIIKNTNKPAMVEHIHQNDKGEIQYIQLFAYPIFDYNNNLHQIIEFCIDITERKLAEDKIKSLLQERELLLQEVHHRIKNNMTMLRSILLIESDKHKNKTINEVLNDCASRIMSMLVLYENLYQNPITKKLDINIFLTDLMNKLINLQKGVINLIPEVEIDSIKIKPKYLTYIGIIINELFSNSIKYAFNNNTNSNNNKINLTVKKLKEELLIIYSDNGVGLPHNNIDKQNVPAEYNNSTENRNSFGLKLVNLLVEQMSGEIKIDQSNGTKYLIKIKI